MASPKLFLVETADKQRPPAAAAVTANSQEEEGGGGGGRDDAYGDPHRLVVDREYMFERRTTTFGPPTYTSMSQTDYSSHKYTLKKLMHLSFIHLSPLSLLVFLQFCSS